MSYSVRRRTRGIGIRMALGAPAAQVLRSFTVQGLAIACTGLVTGLAIALAVTRFAASLLYGISTTDPLTFVLVPSILLVVALLAALFQARRAAKIEPLSAFRYE